MSADLRASIGVDYTEQVFTSQEVPLSPTIAAAENIRANWNRRLATVSVDQECAQSWRVTLDPPTFLNCIGALWGQPNFPGLPPVDDRHPLQALVTWGTQGGRHSALVDWGNTGATFVVHGSYVSVDSFFPIVSVGITSAPATPPFVRLNASVAPCSADRDAPNPTATVYYGSMLPQDLRSIEIPRWAKRVRWHPSQNTSLTLAPGSMWLRQDTDIAGPSAILAVEAFTFTSSSWPNGGWWSLDPNAHVMTIFSNEPLVGGETYQPCLEYALDLG